MIVVDLPLLLDSTMGSFVASQQGLMPVFYGLMRQPDTRHHHSSDIWCKPGKQHQVDATQVT